MRGSLRFLPVASPLHESSKLGMSIFPSAPPASPASTAKPSASPATQRRRYLGTMLLNRATSELVITKPQLHNNQEVELYFQSSACNNDSGNRERYFPALPAELRTNMAVHWLVRRLYQAIPSSTLRERLWLSVSLHIVQLQPAPPAMTPNPHPPGCTATAKRSPTSS